MNRLNIAALSISLLLLTACASLTLEKEIAIGAQQVQDINASMPLINDPLVQAYIDALVEQLLSAAPDSHAVTVRILDSDGFNAFAINGGNIYLTAGVIKASYNVAELASILAHELAHVIHDDPRHFYRSMRTTRMLADLTGVALAVATGNPFIMGAGSIASDLGATTYISTHTRAQERAADELAFQLMLDAGYDPRSQLTMFARLGIHAGRGADTPVFLQTHPLPEERVLSTRKKLDTLPAGLRLRINDDGALDSIQARL